MRLTIFSFLRCFMCDSNIYTHLRILFACLFLFVHLSLSLCWLDYADGMWIG